MRTGRKWQAIQQAESRLHQSKLVGVVTRGGAGLGSFQSFQIDTAKEKEKHCSGQGEVRAAVEGERSCRMVAIRQQDS